jgi:hypothetical protein
MPPNPSDDFAKLDRRRPNDGRLALRPLRMVATSPSIRAGRSALRHPGRDRSLGCAHAGIVARRAAAVGSLFRNRPRAHGRARYARREPLVRRAAAVADAAGIGAVGRVNGARLLTLVATRADGGGAEVALKRIGVPDGARIPHDLKTGR